MVCDECLDVLSLLDRNDHDDDDDDDSSLSEGFLAPKHRSDAEPVTPILVSKNPNKVRDSKTETHRGISDGMVVVWYGGTIPPTYHHSSATQILLLFMWTRLKEATGCCGHFTWRIAKWRTKVMTPCKGFTWYGSCSFSHVSVSRAKNKYNGTILRRN